MDRVDALALLDVMRMQIVHAPAQIDEARLISAYLAVASASSDAPELEDVELADFWRIPPSMVP